MPSIILSRKGFDSVYGGSPSPIWPDGRMLSLPIPPGDQCYGNMKFGDVYYSGDCLGDLVSQLTNARITKASRVHLDPDLRRDALASRRDDWRPAFGQDLAAQGHLDNQGVCGGDLFLFFGWFHQIEQTTGIWRFRFGAEDMHCIFGWLQIAEKIQIGDQCDEILAKYPWLQAHPHLHRPTNRGNAVYIASENLHFMGRDFKVPGAGAFSHFNNVLRLTKPGCSRSVWTVPQWFRRANLSYHSKATRWAEDGDNGYNLRTVGRGQEFVMQTVPEALDWLVELFRSVEIQKGSA